MNEIKKAITILNQGGIVIFPTDTAFGMGCRIDRPAAIEKLFRLRQRPPTQATPVLVSSITMAVKHWTKPSKLTLELAQRYWPGALTIIGKCDPKLIHPLVRGQGDTIGLRWPDHALVQQLITGAGVPILGPSANFHGLSTPFKFADLDQELVKLVDLVLPGECKLNQPSTVVDATEDKLKLVRSGAIRLAGI